MHGTMPRVAATPATAGAACLRVSPISRQAQQLGQWRGRAGAPATSHHSSTWQPSSSPRKFATCALSGAAAISRVVAGGGGSADAKEELLRLISKTGRGGRVTSADRGAVEEAQVTVEAFGGEVPPSLLAGLWELEYTTAPDVTGLLEVENQTMGLVQVGKIYQRFTEDGKVDNIVKFSVPLVVEGGEGLTLEVGAEYSVNSERRISLIFTGASLGRPRISKLLETLIAPAILPRSSQILDFLLWIRELELKVPLQGRTPLQSGSTPGQRVGASYLLTYCDEDILIGRAGGSGGSFVFRRRDLEDGV